MRSNYFKSGKFLTSIACYPLILISNNTQIAAKYLPIEYLDSSKSKDIDQYEKKLLTTSLTSKKEELLVAENGEDDNEGRVLISEIVIDGWEDHPEGRK